MVTIRQSVIMGLAIIATGALTYWLDGSQWVAVLLSLPVYLLVYVLARFVPTRKHFQESDDLRLVRVKRHR